MDRMKTFLKYIMWIILFFIFSEIMININLESTYKNIGRKDNIEQVQIYQSEATIVNGRIRGLITNSSSNNLSGKYLEFDFYSKNDVLLGKKYIQVNDLQDKQTQSIELLFKLKNVGYYNISVVDQKPDDEEIELLPKDLTKPEVILGTALVLLIFW